LEKKDQKINEEKTDPRKGGKPKKSTEKHLVKAGNKGGENDGVDVMMARKAVQRKRKLNARG